MNALESPVFFGGVKLDPGNQWVRLAKLTPWDFIEEQYAASFEGVVTGNPAKPSRMAVGTLIIKERYRFSDEDTVEEIRMNPYLQYYLGMAEFRHEAPFDASTVTRFRKRVTPEMLSKINDRVIGRMKTETRESAKQPEEPPPSGGEPAAPAEQLEEESREMENKGTMILDATCAPQSIRFPTDISLLNEARERLEKLVDVAHAAGVTKGKKPRTYRRKARKDYLRFARNRKPTRSFLRKSLRKQLSSVARDLSHREGILRDYPEAFSERQMERLGVIRTLYSQQKEMYDKRTHHVQDRIVSLSQPHVRPIVRGKAAVAVEFGAKIEMSLVDGYTRIEKLGWDAFNEGGTLQDSVEQFRVDTGHYPVRILADKLFRTRENLAYCKARHILMNGPKLGRPPKDKALYREQQRIERQESGERSAIECEFGVGKRRYTLGYVMTRLKHTSEVSIHVTVLTMNLLRKLRLSLGFVWRRLFFQIMVLFRLPIPALFDLISPLLRRQGLCSRH
jgi:hypothetical protein